MDWKPITDALWGLFALVLIALIGAVGVIAKSLISHAKDLILAKIDNLKDDALKKAAQSALETIDDLVQTTVLSLEQEYGKAIRDSIAANDGKFSRDDLVALHDQAVSAVISTVSPEAKEASLALVDDLDQYVNDKVSAMVYQIKNQK